MMRNSRSPINGVHFISIRFLNEPVTQNYASKALPTLMA